MSTFTSYRLEGTSLSVAARWLLGCITAVGLDPASRRNLWKVIKGGRERAERAIVLTTHSMEEAEILCDRLGIFVDGQLICVGPPRAITAQYGGYLVRLLSNSYCCLTASIHV
jgi:ABC-type multidrug transport system ATPase subunit